MKKKKYLQLMSYEGKFKNYCSCEIVRLEHGGWFRTIIQLEKCPYEHVIPLDNHNFYIEKG